MQYCVNAKETIERKKPSKTKVQGEVSKVQGYARIELFIFQHIRT